MARGRTGWMIKTVVSAEDLHNKINKLIKTYEEAKRTTSKSAAAGSGLFDKEIKNLQELLKEVRIDGRTVMGRTVKRHVEEIAANVLNRYSQRFPNGSTGLDQALNNSEFYRIIYDSSKQEIFIGIGNIDVLDEYTSIYRNSEGNPYEPPGEYNGSGWWRFWEFSGIGPQTQFTSYSTYAYVRSRGWLRTKTIPARPIFLFNYDLFKEDQKILDNLPDAIVTRLLRAHFGRR